MFFFVLLFQGQHVAWAWRGEGGGGGGMEDVGGTGQTAKRGVLIQALGYRQTQVAVERQQSHRGIV